MKKKLLAGLATGLFLVSLVGMANATILIYSNDFENAVGSEWSNTKTEYDNDTSIFLGRFGNETVSLNLTGLDTHTEVAIAFDLIIWDSWDGERVNSVYGMDFQGLNADGASIYKYSFTNFNDPVSNPDTTPQLTGNFGFAGWADSLYENFNDGFNFSHTDSELTLSFYGSGLQSISDESWAIDNIEVYSNADDIAPVPEPATMLLLGTALVGLAGTRLRRKKKQ